MESDGDRERDVDERDVRDAALVQLKSSLGVLLSLSARSVSRDFIFSFEFLTPRPKEDIEKLMSTIDGMVNHGPSFCDLTWRPGGLETDLTLKVAGKMQNEVGVETLLHLAVTSMTMEMIDHALDTAKAKGTNNILALKGDPVKGKDPAQDPLQCALYLVKYIRAKHGDYFGIAVAGYPGHLGPCVSDCPPPLSLSLLSVEPGFKWTWTWKEKAAGPSFGSSYPPPYFILSFRPCILLRPSSPSLALFVFSTLPLSTAPPIVPFFIASALRPAQMDGLP
ncbi:hypothetical protein AAC387_Pa06g1873 [Persea americana]